MIEHGAGDAPRTLLVTSAIPGEGKSTLVSSLALTYFESAKSVLLIDADMRRPMLHEFFDAPLVPGLADVLRSSISLSDAVQEIRHTGVEPAFDPVLVHSQSMGTLEHLDDSNGLSTRFDTRNRGGGPARGPVMHLLAAGSQTSDPAALLGSDQLKSVLAEAAETYDLVLIDSPPVLSVSDAIPAATAADAVLVVAREEFTTRDAATRCRQALERVEDVTVLGVVANAVRDDGKHGEPYYIASSA